MHRDCSIHIEIVVSLDMGLTSADDQKARVFSMNVKYNFYEDNLNLVNQFCVKVRPEFYLIQALSLCRLRSL